MHPAIRAQGNPPGMTGKPSILGGSFTRVDTPRGAAKTADVEHMAVRVSVGVFMSALDSYLLLFVRDRVGAVATQNPSSPTSRIIPK
jgi:hypothetical protein